ncbi:MAG: flagellar hook-associated protein FlgK, partial [Gammaproteobacteria bacterium]|nr:flagellar hook-associated protein FlgK [Gammaproteobacteria bacterium]
GGVLGGLLEYRAQILEPSRRALGETAVALVEKFNSQHGAGMDLRGNLGTDFFGVGTPTVLTSAFNSGSGTANATIADVSSLSGADYILEFDGAAYSLQRTDNGQVVPMTGSGTPADPFVADGLSIVTGGAPAAGDRLMIRPSRDIAASVSRDIDDAQAIAMATPVRVALANSNLGDAAIGSISIVDQADPNLLTPSVIRFLDPTTYSINGAGAFAFTSGDPITINGASFVIEGAPDTGDIFTIEPNYGGIGDNGNGLLLSGVQAEGILAGGTISINDSYGQLVANVGSTTRQVQANLGAQTVLLSNTEDSYLAKSGVNLDEEAANLLRYQQAYQAVAQVVAVANTLFDSLLNATRR